MSLEEKPTNKTKKVINPVITIYATVNEGDPKFDKTAMDKAIKKIVSHYLPDSAIEIKYNEIFLCPPPQDPDGELH